MFRLSVPEVVRFNRSSYPDQDQLLDELDIGPEIMHIYQVGKRKVKACFIDYYFSCKLIQKLKDKLSVVTNPVTKKE